MELDKKCVLTINSGSSSIKFALYKIEEPLTKLFYGKMESIGTKNTKLSFSKTGTNQKNSEHIAVPVHADAANFLIDWLEKQDDFGAIKAIGHRIVYGMKHTVPEQITPALLEEFKQISSYDPEHMPGAIKLIEAFGQRYPTIAQIACFDTSFHAFIPQVAKLLPIPRRFQAMGIQRYGFHGLSYAWLMEELKRVAGRETAQGSVILAHLGNGASLAAVKNGKSLDTSMGFTPTSGLPMGTRSGDLDPGVAWYLMQHEQFSPDQFSHLINHESGLLGISETSADMRELIQCQGTDARAAEAIELFCYQTKKWIGSYAAVLGGLDTLIFSGGIGEHEPEIRRRICEGLEFLGIEWDEPKNVQNEAIVSTPQSKVCVRVIKTNEELMIARMVCESLNYAIKN
ncbi:MAG TPA: acetate/propionate family kinase [Haliscomenobacter sp.]|uniref:acetate/propionate family kinase n=1 Tax=Haliscomenobacter sp. TaxID=2717303 RepID=UPI002C90A597|nr:acetate/propionate family kinase [Haliscomenobacter sp.]HOY17617.1 acetate/propionate family kinase [Haliscomenobacter sp.]